MRLTKTQLGAGLACALSLFAAPAAFATCAEVEAMQKMDIVSNLVIARTGRDLNQSPSIIAALGEVLSAPITDATCGRLDALIAQARL
jgi:hypothetical protein